MVLDLKFVQQAQRFLEHSLGSAVQADIQFSIIDGLTIENRAAHKQAIPDSVLAQLKACDVILKVANDNTPKGDQWPNIESANVVMRRELIYMPACVQFGCPAWALIGSCIGKILKGPTC